MFAAEGACYVAVNGRDLPGVPSGLLLQQELLLFTGELQVQLEGVVVQGVDVLLDVAGRPLGQRCAQHRESL